MFVIQSPEQVRFIGSGTPRCGANSSSRPIIEAARDDILAFNHFPQER